MKAPDLQEFKTVETEVKTWAQKHERLIIVVLVLLAVVFLYNKVIDRQAAHDVLVANQAAQTLKAQTDKDTALAQAAAAQQQQYVALVQQLTTENSTLAAQQSQRTVVLQTQVQHDAALPVPALGTRIATLEGLQATDVTPTTSGLIFSPDASYKVTESLEQIPVLQANLVDETTQNQNLTTELTAADRLSAEKDTVITNLNLTVTDTQVEAKTQLTACKATARKGKLHAFLYGVGVGAGAVGAIVIHALL
jgi:hypothetical protein